MRRVVAYALLALAALAWLLVLASALDRSWLAVGGDSVIAALLTLGGLALLRAS